MNARIFQDLYYFFHISQFCISVLCSVYFFSFLLFRAPTYFYSIFFFFFKVTPVAYGSFQARGGNGAAAHSHSDTGSELCLLPTLQPTAAKDP